MLNSNYRVLTTQMHLWILFDLEINNELPKICNIMDKIECLDFYPLSHPAPTIVQCNAEVKYILVVRVFRKSPHSSYLSMHASISEYFYAFFSWFLVSSNLLKFLLPPLLKPFGYLKFCGFSLLKIKIGWVLWCIKVQICKHLYCELMHSSNWSTTPLRQWSFQQCLPFSFR